MSGGSAEFTASYVNNSYANSTYSTSLVNASTQYKNVYSIGTSDTSANNYAASFNIFGDAIHETSTYSPSNLSWNSDTADMSRTTNPWFIRGGTSASTSAAGIFNFTSFGPYYADVTFRPIILVQNGL
jgi:hypothetical protein